jgi:hypothetical protein
VQQSSFNSADLKLPVDAVSDLIFRSPPSELSRLSASSNRLRVLLNNVEVTAGDRRGLFLSFDGLTSSDAVVERAVDALADTAMRLWPVWYSCVSFADIRNDTLGRVVQQAYAVGRAAVEFAIAGKNAVMPAIRRLSDSPYRWDIIAAPPSEVANQEKLLPPGFISADGFGITAAARRYLAPPHCWRSLSHV